MRTDVRHTASKFREINLCIDNQNISFTALLQICYILNIEQTVSSNKFADTYNYVTAYSCRFKTLDKRELIHSADAWSSIFFNTSVWNGVESSVIL